METLFFRTAGYNQPMGELNWKALTSSTCVYWWTYRPACVSLTTWMIYIGIRAGITEWKGWLPASLLLLIASSAFI